MQRQEQKPSSAEPHWNVDKHWYRRSSSMDSRDHDENVHPTPEPSAMLIAKARNDEICGSAIGNSNKNNRASPTAATALNNNKSIKKGLLRLFGVGKGRGKKGYQRDSSISSNNSSSSTIRVKNKNGDEKGASAGAQQHSQQQQENAVDTDNNNNVRRILEPVIVIDQMNDATTVSECTNPSYHTQENTSMINPLIMTKRPVLSTTVSTPRSGREEDAFNVNSPIFSAGDPFADSLQRNPTPRSRFARKAESLKQRRQRAKDLANNTKKVETQTRIKDNEEDVTEVINDLKASSSSSSSSFLRAAKRQTFRSIIRNCKRDVIQCYKQQSFKSSFVLDGDEANNDPLHRAGLRLLTAAAVPIQTIVRRHLAFREAVLRMCAIVVIQSVMRGSLARRAFLEQRRLAIKVQAVYRGGQARESILVEHCCAIEIQRLVRGHLATMQVYGDIYKISIIQSIVRRNMAIDLAMYRMAFVMHIQSIVRGFLSRRRFQQMLVTHKNQAATKIQTQWRSYDCTMNYLHRLADVIVTQSAIRRWLARREVNRRVEECLALRAIQEEVEYKAALDIQKTYRGFVWFRCYKEFSAARNIQRVWRGYVCHISVADLMASRKEAAGAIQAIFRGFVSRQTFKQSIDAVVDIQKVWRGFVCHSNYAEEKASIVLQKNWRGIVGRQRAKEIKSAHSTNTNGATIIQANWRRFVWRRDYVELQNVIIIQTIWRRFVWRRDYVEYKASRSIQAAWRGFIQRDDYLLTISDRSATLIQSQWRGFREYLHYSIIVGSIIHIQALYRGYVARKAIQGKLLTQMEEQVAANKIQSIWRCYMVREPYKEYIACRRIQTVWRCHITRESYKEYIAARQIQRILRGWIARREMFERDRLVAAMLGNSREEDIAARKIQSFFLMVKAEVDREIEAQRAKKKRRHKAKKKKKKKKKDNFNDDMLEDVWQQTIDLQAVATFATDVSRAVSNAKEVSVSPKIDCVRAKRISAGLQGVKRVFSADQSMLSGPSKNGNYRLPSPRVLSLTSHEIDDDSNLEKAWMEAWIDTEINGAGKRRQSGFKHSSRDPPSSRRQSGNK